MVTAPPFPPFELLVLRPVPAVIERPPTNARSGIRRTGGKRDMPTNRGITSATKNAEVTTPFSDGSASANRYRAGVAAARCARSHSDVAAHTRRARVRRLESERAAA